ncbi:MAG: hypothetical protein U9R75_04145 [Candidatus Thermoplasmatota archaeon]|nr:hypothetical protein [Candidatus Thermoplasmatota archaeon]
MTDLASSSDDSENMEARFYINLLTHDIKNLNQGACGYMELITMMPETTDAQKKLLEEALSYVRMSSNLIGGIEAEAKLEDGSNTISVTKIIEDSTDYLLSLNNTLDLDISKDGFDEDQMILGNILWIDLFLYLMDHMVKMSKGRSPRIKVRRMISHDNDVIVTIEGNVQAGFSKDAKYLFSGRPGSDEGQGKLLLCRSIAERFGGKVIYRSPKSGNEESGEFQVTMKGVEQ